jgi:probable H4MPT-linked C1 transfer pathway protein
MAAVPEDRGPSEDRQRRRVGWDIGGAHVKACLLEDGHVVDVGQWPCALWRGLDELDAALRSARLRWPQAWDGYTRHAATMTGEMVDLFPGRAEGVAGLAARLAEALGPTLALWGGRGGFRAPHEAAHHWRDIASANWRATAEFVASRRREALIVDVGSTTTDIVPVRHGATAARGRTDAERLATGELVYQGVVRTPLCALAARVAFDGHVVNVMNEFFATTADVYRLTGELQAEHDQHPAADGGGKDLEATCRRLARMVGCDESDHPRAQWRGLAEAWREAQLADIESQVDRVTAASGVPAGAPVVGAGCGAFLAREIALRTGRPFIRFSHVASDPLADGAGGLARSPVAGWADVCAPAVAVALLAEDED